MAINAKQKALEKRMEDLASEGIGGWDDARVAATDAALQLRRSYGVASQWAAARVAEERRKRGLDS